jgi:hypothetical protein
VVAWFLNPALTRFRNEVNSRWPRRDKTSDGTIGDPAHQATSSDHNQDADGSVDAWDMDVDGVDVKKVIEAALKHESIQYVIYNRRITSRSWGLGTWRPYTGSSPHDKHVHFNTRPSHENSNKPWFTDEEDELSGFGYDSNQVADDVAFRVNKTYAWVANDVIPAIARMEASVNGLATAIKGLTNDADKDEILTTIRAEGEKAAAAARADVQRDEDLRNLVNEFKGGGATAEEVMAKLGELLTNQTS